MSLVTSVTPVPGSRADRADAVADAVRRVPGVVDLHGGAVGEVGTYLAGRRVLGVRLRPEATEVHVTLAYGTDARKTASAVRDAVAQVVPGAVDVVVEDVQSVSESSPETDFAALGPSPAGSARDGALLGFTDEAAPPPLP